MPGFGRHMRGLDMVERIGAKFRQRCRRRGADKAIEQHRNAAMPCGERGAEYGGKLAAAERGRDQQRIVRRAGMPCNRLVDRGRLRASLVVDAGAASGPSRATAAEQTRRNRRRGGGVADAHFTETNKIGLRPTA